MPPEDIAALAALHGLPVEHFDGHSIVHTPDGPMPIAHPAATLPPRVAAPGAMPVATPRVVQRDAPAGHRPRHAPTVTPVSTPAAEALAARARADIAAYHAAQSARSAPDANGIVTHGSGAREGAPGAFQREAEAQRIEQLRHTPTSAGTMTFPDGSSVTTGNDGLSRMVGSTGAGTLTLPDGTSVETDATGSPISIPEGTPPEWLTGDARMEADLRSGARSAQAADRTIRASAPVAPTGGPAVDVGVPPMLARPTEPVHGGAGRPAGPQLSANGLTYANAPAVDTDGVASYMPGGANYSAQDTGPDSLGGQPIGTARRAPDSIDRQMLLEQQRAGLAQKAAQTQLGIEQQAEQQRQQLEQDRQAAVQQAQQRYQNAIQRVSDAHLDPQRWFRDQGAGGTVAAVIAVALGAAGQALTGASTNGALDQINQAIDRDMQAQQSEIDGARAGADLQGNMLNITRQEFSDRQAAHDAARAGMLQQAALHVQEMEGSLAGQEAQVSAEAMRAQLEQQAAEARAVAEERQSQIDLRQAQALRELQNARIAGVRADRMEHPGAARPRPVTAAQADGYRNVMALNPELTPEQGAYLAGLPFVPTQTVTLAEQNDIAPLEAELANLEQLLPVTGDVPGVGPLDGRAPDLVTSPEGLDIRESVGQVLELLGRLHSGGAISDDENRRFTTLIGSGATQSDTALRRGVQTIRREIGARLRGRPRADSSVDRTHAEVGFTPDA